MIGEINEKEEALKIELEKTKFPLEGGQMFTLEDKRILGFEIYGEKENATEVVLFFHGTPGSRFFITNEMENSLLRNKVKLYILERPGFGLSTPHHERTFETWANDVKQFINKEIQQKVSLIGYSAGGPYAIACAKYIPELLINLFIISSPSPPEAKHLYSEMDFTSKIGYFLARNWRWGLEKAVHFEAKKWKKNPIKQTKDFLRGCLPDAQTYLLHPSIQRAFVISCMEQYSRPHTGVTAEVDFEDCFNRMKAVEGEQVCIQLSAHEINTEHRIILFQGGVQYSQLLDLFSFSKSGFSNIIAPKKKEFLTLNGPRGKGSAQIAVGIKEIENTSFWKRFSSPVNPTLNYFLTEIILTLDSILNDLLWK